MANASRTIYVGVTSNLERRVWEHKTHVRDGFAKQHNATKLVYIAEFERIDDAIAWEKAVKGKPRAKKVALIEERNPRWNDLAWNWFDDAQAPATPSSAIAALRTGILRLRLQNDDIEDVGKIEARAF
ncbi:MAG: GIY-YIG nuclease family protein [Chloroflexota bacterium]|nr:GIY-YIG nuclease family protein [Chloroflexota bacterium]